MNIHKFLAMALIGFMLVLTGCWNKTGESNRQQLYVINVLDKALYDDCHIKGSIQVPFDGIERFAKNVPKDAHIVIYCSNYQCTASSAVAKILLRLGFQHVWAYEGGIADWYQRGLPVEGACQQSYLQQKVDSFMHDVQEVPVISAQELKQKIDQMAA